MLVPKLNSLVRLNDSAPEDLKKIFGKKSLRLKGWRVYGDELYAVVKGTSTYDPMNSFKVDYLDII